MEFCPQLSAFQGVIISADNVHPFSRLSSKSGNEDQINYIVSKLSNFLEEVRFIDENGPKEEAMAKVRKFAFFLILNADLYVLSKMTDLEDIESVIWTIPTIPKCLLCEIFWQLHFEKFVYEAIAFTYPELGLELASAFTDSIKYCTPHECLSKLKIISSALYRLLCRFNYFYFQNNLTDKLTMTFNCLQNTLNYFSDPPKADKLNNLSKDDLYKYMGKSLYSMVCLVYDCFEQFTTTQEFNSVDDPIYMLTYLGGNINKEINFKPCENPNEAILECSHKCNEALLDKCQILVMGVSVDIFCAWSEFEESGKSVQKKIGEFCYKLRTKLLSVPSISEHSVMEMLQQISCKPEDVNDIVMSADADTIIKNITESNENKVTWLRALLRKGQFIENEALVGCVASNLNLLSEEECFEIYKDVRKYIIIQPGSEDYLESFEVKLFQHCNLKAKHEILEEYFSDNCFIDMTETDDFYNMMTEVFNKLIVSSDADLTDILYLFLQNPQKVYSKIFTLAAENSQQTAIMLKAMKLLIKFSNHYYSFDTEPCIIRITQNTLDQLDTDTKKQNFINFICALKSSNFITEAKLLLLIIMPNIHKSLLNRDLVCLNLQCRLLKNAYSVEELLEYRAPMLAMIAQILETTRWKINTFSNIAPPTLQTSLDLQISLFSTYNTGIPDKESSWLKSKLRNIEPLNMYYYRKLWSPPGNNYVEIISGINLDIEMDTHQLVLWLSQVLCSTTQQEWCNVWNSLAIFGDVKTLDMFYNAVSLISMAEKANRTEVTWACVLHCFRNFVFVIRYKFFKEPLTDSQVSNVVEKIVTTCNMVEEDTDDLSTVFLPLLAYLAERRKDFNFEISQYLENKLKHSKFLDTLSKVFSNGVYD